MAHDGGGTGRSTLTAVRYDFLCDDGPVAHFRVVRFRFVEEINGCFEIDIDLATEDLTADTDLFLSASCQLDIARGEHLRTVYGIVMAVDIAGQAEDYLILNLRVVPAAHLLDYQSHSRIFQDMTTLEILDAVLEPELKVLGRTFDKGSASRGTAPREYCVQYRETDFDFCTRLLEEEGISYYFEHNDDLGHEVLTLVHENADLLPVENVDGTPALPVVGRDDAITNTESIQQFGFSQTLTPTATLRRDYDFLTPLELIEHTEDGADTKGFVRRIYRHTDRRHGIEDVASRAADHLQALQSRAKVGRGTSNSTSLAAGKIFDLEFPSDRLSRDDLETSFVLTRIIHTGECPEELHSSAEESDDSHSRYANTFRCVPLEVPLRPRQATPRPRVLGPETAIVSGPSGEEIHVDEHGRVKVQFHWEEETTYDDTSSCWVRVRQQWSGPGWGFQFIPRIGQEVVVEFLGGDPDRPLVVGTVYNGDNGYPYPLPDEKTRSGIKTDSISGDGSNELRFEDQSGSEEVYLHCQKDLTIATENDKNQNTGHDETLAIGNDRTKEVGHDQSETVKNDKTILVEGNHSEMIVKDMTLTVEGNRSCKVTKDHDETITGAYSQVIEKTKKVNVTAEYDESVGSDKTVKVTGAIDTSSDAAISMSSSLSTTISAGKDATVKSEKNLKLGGADDVEQKSGKKMSILAGKDLTIKTDTKGKIEAADKFTIKVGDAKIELKSNGDILINGAKIDVKGSGAVAVKGSTVDNN